MNSKIMSGARKISEAEIFEFLKKGSAKARKIIEDAPISEDAKADYLQTQFTNVAHIAGQLLDNFDRNKFLDRKNDVKPTNELKLMLMAAFEVVQCLEYLEPALANIKHHKGFLDDKALDAHMRLLRAVRVFKSNGKEDAYSLQAQRALVKFQKEDGFRPDKRHCA